MSKTSKKTVQANNPEDKTSQGNILKFELPESGIIVEMDKSRNNGHALFAARKACPDADVDEITLFIISLICTFNGEQIPAPELKNLSTFDIVKLEQGWSALRKKP